ncbi:SIR2 family protein [Candidatus Peregrinibacteria bacterium]|nr:SIR2 family protein [Candidatus Peregrinibacteria bacterium]
MIIWPKEFVYDLARRRTVVVLGSGISRNSVGTNGRIPRTWEKFLLELSKDVNPKRHITRLIHEKDYLTACELILKSIGRDRFNQCLKDEFLNPGYQHSEIHKWIFALDSRIVATPNFDKIYETYANHEAHASITVKHHDDPDIAEAVRATGRLILKIHGTIDSPNQMVFTRNEYAAARSKYANFYSLLEALALTHTFLFLGCGVHDPDIRLLLEDIFCKHPSSPRHVFVIPRGDLHKQVIEILQESMNLSILTYSPDNDHKELIDSVKELSELVEAERAELKTNGNW